MKGVIKAANIAYPGEALWHSILPLMPQNEGTAAEYLNLNITILWPNPSNPFEQKVYGSSHLSPEITQQSLHVEVWK